MLQTCDLTAGDIVFYEKKGNGTCKKLSSVRCPSVSLEWSPCGRFVLTAITAPRLRVDNGVKCVIIPRRISFAQFIGAESSHISARRSAGNPQRSCLKPDGYPSSRGHSKIDLFPRTNALHVQPFISVVGWMLRNVFYLVSQKAKQEDTTTAAYVPPHLRGSNRTAAPVSFNLGQSNDSGGRIHSQPKGPDVPGGTFLSKAAAKNAKRRAKRKTELHKQITESADRQTPEATAAPETSSIPQTVSSSTSPLSSATPEEKTKRIRTLRKKLKQIGHLKDSMQQPGPCSWLFSAKHLTDL